ncbi:cbb3-type cytochrome oxidase assembly protein CcoS [Bacteriovorax sp. BSW11_IV]|uniref:cbb3-type cytochrome oxidase assembly protein CcoS n=1 Tax=Bacteriovorax sp. BSW11_IV TaxID=1353529 RepID=UPI0005561693|nr:cbb3-type cytochrome oxidase assembly protein CcoS [Bacteriovorax sp. BSW11_IV]
MEIIYLLLPIALILGCVFIGMFVWATKEGQYDDLETPAHRMLLEDKKLVVNKNVKSVNRKKEDL